MPLGPIRRFNTIGPAELKVIDAAINAPLSGYLAGRPRGGPWVRRLEDAWAERFGVSYAIACNSATSGLLAASAVCSPEFVHQEIAVPCFTMSATAAAPRIACPDHDLYFMDCDSETYCSTPSHCPTDIGLIIVTDLFGQAAPLNVWRTFANNEGCLLIEDASQAPFAETPDGKLAGTVGDVGVFSLNVHKHLQVGEGGIIVTNEPELAARMREYVNHGECQGRTQCGLNLRMTEIGAAMACVQLEKADEIIASRRELAHELSDMVKGFWTPPVEDGKHVFYIWAVRVPRRNRVALFLQKGGIPVRTGYVNPLHRLPAFQKWASPCPVAEKAHDHDLLIFEICSWDPTKEQLRQMREIFQRAAEFSTIGSCPAS